MLDNWYSDFLIDIKINPDNLSCQSLGQDVIYFNFFLSNQYYSLFSYKWPGTTAGCDCRNVSRGQNIINNNNW